MKDDVLCYYSVAFHLWRDGNVLHWKVKNYIALASLYIFSLKKTNVEIHFRLLGFAFFFLRIKKFDNLL